MPSHAKTQRLVVILAALFALPAALAQPEAAPELGVPLLIPVDVGLAVHIDGAVEGATDSCVVDSSQLIGFPEATEDECREPTASGNAKYLYTYYCSTSQCRSHYQSDGSSHVRVHTCAATSAFSCVAWTWWADIDDGVFGASGSSGQTGQAVQTVSQKVGQTVQQNSLGQEFFGYFGAGVRIA